MADKPKLTDRQRKVYEYIRSLIEKRGYGPTVREIGQKFGIRSPNGVMCHLRALVNKGLIKRDKRSARAIQLVNHRKEGTGLPLLGTVAAGAPIEAIENAERISLDEMFSGRNRFALRVRGNSMIDDHIQDGDIVVIKKQETAENGQRVVVMIDGEVTLKRFYKAKNHIRLEPANPEMDTIIIGPDESPVILGVLVGVIRKC